MASVTISPELRRLVAERRRSGCPSVGRSGDQHMSSGWGGQTARSDFRPGRQFAATREGHKAPLSAGRPLVALRVRRSGQRPIEDHAMALVSGSSSGAAGHGRFHLAIHQTNNDGFVLSVEHDDGHHQRHLVEASRHCDVDGIAKAIANIRPEDHVAWSRLQPVSRAPTKPVIALEELAGLRDAVRAEFNEFIAEHLPALFHDQ